MTKPKIEVINDLLGYEGLKIIQRPDIFNFRLIQRYLPLLLPSTNKINSSLIWDVVMVIFPFS